MKLAQFYLGNVDSVNPQIAPVRILAASPTVLAQEDAYTALATAHLSLFRTNSSQALDYWFGQPQFYGYGVFRLRPSEQMPYSTAIGSLIRPQQANPRSPYLYRYVLLTAEDAIALGGDWPSVAARPDEADLIKRIQPRRPAALPDLNVNYTPEQAEAFQRRSSDLLLQYFGDRRAGLQSLLSTLFIPQPVIVQNLPEDDQTRAEFAAALAAIFPPSLRSLISLAMRLPSIEEANVHFKFLSAGQEQQITRKAGWVYDFQTGEIKDGDRAAGSSPYLEQAISALSRGAAALLDYQQRWDETAARLFRNYGDAMLAQQYLDRWVALESAPDGDQWLALLYDDQSLAEAARVEEIRALADWLRERNRPLPEGLLDVAMRHADAEPVIQGLLATERNFPLSEAMLAKLRATARKKPNWNRFVEELITDYARRVEAGEDAYRMLRAFGDEAALSLEALEAQVRLAGRQRPTAEHAHLLLRVALKKAPARRLLRWIEENPGWLPVEWQAVFKEGGSPAEALAGLPEVERASAVIKLSVILQAQGQIAGLTPILPALMEMAEQVSPQPPLDEAELLDRITWDTSEQLGRAAEWLIAAIRTPDEGARYRLLWWYTQFRADTEARRIDDLLPGIGDPVVLVDRLLAVDASFTFSPHDQLFLVTIFERLPGRDFAFAALRRTMPNWQGLAPLIEGLVSGLDTEDRLTEFDVRLIDSGLPAALLDWLIRRDSPAQANLLEWWGRVFGIELSGGQKHWNQIARWLKAAHPAIGQNPDAYARYVGRLQQTAQERGMSAAAAEYLRSQFDTRMVLERQWLKAIITARRIAALLAMARQDDLPLRLLRVLYEWQTETEAEQTELIAGFVRQARAELSREQIKHLRNELEAYIVMLQALAKPNEPVPEAQGGINKLLQRMLQPQTEPTTTFPLLRKLAAAISQDDEPGLLQSQE